MTKEQSIKELMTIPSVGKSIANDLWNWKDSARIKRT